jgi:hypothetical protein
MLFVAFAALGATAQADTTCKDGTTSEVSGRGACSHHGGVAKHHAERTRATKHTHTDAEPTNKQARPAPHKTTDDDVQWSEPRGERTPAPTRKRESGSPTAVCRDGKLSYALHHRGACSDHGGVERWLD